MTSTIETASQSGAGEQVTQPFVMSPIPPEAEAQAKRGWEIAVNDKPVNVPVTDARFRQTKMGIEITYGQRPEGYDGVVIHELGGGGAVTIPYMVHPESGEVYVGVVEENRPLLGGNVLNVPRGFLDVGETHEDAAQRELKEETGYDVKALGGRVVKLTKEGLNPNSTFYDTSGSPDEGVHIFAVRVEPNELEVIKREDGSNEYVFPATIRDTAQGNKAAERILGSRFIPVGEAGKSRDMFTQAATGKLMTALFDGELPYLGPANTAPQASVPEQTKDQPLSPEEVKQTVEYLRRLPRGFLPFDIFNAVAELVTTPTVEVAPVRMNADGKAEVLLLQRDVNDPYWPGQWHMPGTVLRSTDKPGDFSSAFQRVFGGELAGRVTPLSEPVLIGVNFWDVERGRELANKHFVEVEATADAELPGQFYTLDNLPDNLIAHHGAMIPEMLAAFEATKTVGSKA